MVRSNHQITSLYARVGGDGWEQVGQQCSGGYRLRIREFSEREKRMRLRREIIHYVAQAIARDLTEQEFVEVLEGREKLEEMIRTVITEELHVEDRLNDEVKELLRAYSSEFSKGEADYYKMFSMVKRKLAQERGLIL
jgi:uncharacterized protein